MTSPTPDPLPTSGFTVNGVTYQAGAADPANSVFWLGELVVRGQGGGVMTDELGTAAAAAAQAFADTMVGFHPELGPWVVPVYNAVLEGPAV